MAEITSKLASWNPFPKTTKQPSSKEADEDQGGVIDPKGRSSTTPKSQLRVSSALKAFLAANGILSPAEAEAESSLERPGSGLRTLLERSHIHVPAELIDRSHPLPDYFISSSHNTYLAAHQLYGTSTAAAYKTALVTGSRCVEIDAWDNDADKEEPEVTHGYTLVSPISFRAVCETIRDVVDKEASESANAQGYCPGPIFLSLENHCGTYGQARLVQIMKEVWGERLLSKGVRQKGHDEQEGGDHVTLEELGSKIVVIVEYHLPAEASDGANNGESDESSDDERERDSNADPDAAKETAARRQFKEKEKQQASTIIIPELAAIGIYAQSVKPNNNSWFEELKPKHAPHHHLINVSETKLAALMSANSSKIARHNSHALMRVFPKGTRISSKNLHPVPFWGVGAQICALNWQTFGAAMQINTALFSCTDGYVLKPAALRAGGNGRLVDASRKVKLRLHVAGATDVLVPNGRDEDQEIKPYVTCSLIHPDDLKNTPPKRKTAGYKQHKLKTLMHKDDLKANPPVTDPVWDEQLEWEYQDDDLAFLRILIKSDDRFASNPVLVGATVRLLYVVKGWTFIRMLDLTGKETKCTLLVKFDIADA